MSETTYYKFLDANQTGRHSRKRLPIGEWISVDGPLEMCANGIHVTTIEHALEWLDERAHIVEIRGEHIVGYDKICCREVFIQPAILTWSERQARLFATDCAERVLPLFERERPGDDRPRKAIEAARAFARGEISDAARAAAEAAAHAAAEAAAHAAARAAAGAAARAAAGAAARDAAGAAARAAAWDAARDAALDAAWDAARAAAHADAWGAAWDAERRWQNERLSVLLHGGTR